MGKTLVLLYGIGSLSILIVLALRMARSKSNRKFHSSAPKRVSQVSNSPEKSQNNSAKLLGQLIDAKKVAEPVGTNLPRAMQDSKGPLALHLSPTDRMKRWLSKQKPEVVDAVANWLNWDEAGEVILWLLKRRKTDAATAVKLFMKSEPAWYGLDGVRPVQGFAKKVIEEFSANWIAGHYARGTVGFDPRDVPPNRTGGIRDYNEFAGIEPKKRASGQLPWPPLRGREGPFQGPKPKKADEYFKLTGKAILSFGSC